MRLRFWIPFIVSLLVGVIGGVVVASAAGDWKWGLIFGMVGFIAPYSVAFAIDIAKYAERMDFFDRAYRTVFGNGFVDTIRFRGEFSHIVESLMSMKAFSEQATRFTKDALEEMTRRGIIRIGCGRREYFRLIEELSAEATKSICVTYWYPEVECAMPTWLIDAPDRTEEASDRQATVTAYGRSSARNKVRVQILTKSQIQQLQSTDQHTLQSFWQLASGFGNFYVSEERLERDAPGAYLLGDYEVFDDALMLQYDYERDILTLAWMGERFQKARALFQDLSGLQKRGIARKMPQGG